MCDQSPAPEVTETLKRLPQEVPKHAFPLKEKTFFSIEGIIGRLENPTTELLHFFMAPNGGHDLGPLFLRAFFACLVKDCSDFRFEGVTVWPQDQTDDRKIIDLLISGSNWVLLIENKIKDQISNPLALYEKHAKRYFPNQKTYLAILSPDGKTDPEFPQWKAVSYQNYCHALKSEFTKSGFSCPISKWQIFAREFIVHLENELYNPAMTMKPEQTDFVEKNLREIRDLKKLSDCYTADLQSELSERLRKEVPGSGLFQFSEKPDFAFLCIEDIGPLQLQFHFQTPAHGLSDAGRDFVISAWVRNLTEAQHRSALELLGIPRFEPEDRGLWIGVGRFKNRRDAVNELCKLAKQLFNLWGNESQSLPPADEAA